MAPEFALIGTHDEGLHLRIDTPDNTGFDRQESIKDADGRHGRHPDWRHAGCGHVRAGIPAGCGLSVGDRVLQRGNSAEQRGIVADRCGRLHGGTGYAGAFHGQGQEDGA